MNTLRNVTLLLLAVTASGQLKAQAPLTDTTAVAEQLIAAATQLVPRAAHGEAQHAFALLDSATALSHSARVYIASASLGLTMADSALALAARTARCADARVAETILMAANAWIPVAGQDTPELLRIEKADVRLFDRLTIVRRLCLPDAKRKLMAGRNARPPLATTPSRDTVSAIVPRLAIFSPTYSAHAVVRIDGPTRMLSVHIGFLVRGSDGRSLAIFPDQIPDSLASALDPANISDIRVLKGGSVPLCLRDEFDGGFIVVTLSVAGTKKWNAVAFPPLTAERARCVQAP